MERIVVRNRTRSKINFKAPFWQILKAIGVVFGIISSALVFYGLNVCLWAIS